MQAPVTHILPLSGFRRARMLPRPGRVLVRSGQEVNPRDPIAEMNLRSQHVLLDVRKSLGISRSLPLERVLHRKAGDAVETDDVIAETKGLFSKALYSPIKGRIVSIFGSQVLIEGEGEPFQLLAGINGTVVELVPERGAIIESSGAIIQGAWGNGQIEAGMLLNLAKSPDEVLNKSLLDVSMRGAVVMSGHCAQAEALQAADQLPLRGLILGSMTADLIPVARSLSFPLILLEGIGRIPINMVAFRILSTNEKRDVTLNACFWNPFTGDRPEVFIPLPATGHVSPETDEFKPGQTVRVFSLPYAGRVGTIVELPPGNSRLASGLRAPVAMVRFESDQPIAIPLANLDVLE